MFIDCMLRALEVSGLYVTLIAIVFIIIIIINIITGISLWPTAAKNATVFW